MQIFFINKKFTLSVLQTTQASTATQLTPNATVTTTTATSTASPAVAISQNVATVSAPGSIEENLLNELLRDQPPGTIIKCVTAQVIQTTEGPRIVLQGLQGADFTPYQLNMVQQQVKQQLLKG